MSERGRDRTRVQSAAARQWLILLLLAPAFVLISPSLSPMLLVLPALWTIRKIGYSHFVPSTPLNGSLLLLMVMVLVSAIITYDLALSLPKIAGLVYGIALFFAIADLGRRTERHLWFGIGLLIAAGYGVVALALISVDWRTKLPFLTDVLTFLPERVLSRPGTDEGVNPNEIAGVLLWIAPVALGLAVASVRSNPFAGLFSGRLSRVLRPVAWATAAIQCGILILTQSRAALLGLSTSLVLIVLLFSGPYRRAWGTGLAAVVVIGALAIWQAGPSRVAESLLAQGGVEATESVMSSLEGRIEIWSRALYGIQDFPFTGMGMNTFREVIHILYPTFLIPPDTLIAHPHNHLLQAAVDLGLPGLIAYLAVWVGAAGMLWRTWQAARVPRIRALTVGFAAALAAYFVYGLLDAVALGARPGFLFWILLGLIAALYERVVVLSDDESTISANRSGHMVIPPSPPDAPPPSPP